MDASVRTLAGELTTTLDLVAELLTELHPGDACHRANPKVSALVERLRGRPDLHALPGVLLKVHGEVVAALGGIRLSRELIQTQTLDRLRRTQSTLDEVSTTTESATMELMNGLERALALADTLDAGAAATGGQPAATVSALRDELTQLFALLQFQDITAQQLHGVADMLVDVEHRIQAVADQFDGSAGAAPAPPTAGRDRAAYNPDATVRHTADRQAFADAAFGQAAPAA